MPVMLTPNEISIARKIKSLPGFVYRTGLVFIDLSAGHQKRIVLTDPVWVRHVQTRHDIVPDVSDSFLVGMLQNMLGWPEIKTYQVEADKVAVMVDHPDNVVKNRNPVIARAIGLYQLALERNNLLPF